MPLSQQNSLTSNTSTSSDSSASSDDSSSSNASQSSQASLKIYQEKLKPSMDCLKDVFLPDLVDQAWRAVTSLFAPDPRSIYTYGDLPPVNLSTILLAMLQNVEECGGEKGKRYVASAIVACTLVEEQVVDALVALGITWLTHFLFLFKSNHTHRTQTNDTPSELAAPTIRETAAHLSKGVGHRRPKFRDNVIQRDGYTCVLTLFKDSEHPNLDPETTASAYLEVAHIIRRAIGNFESTDKESKSYKSALVSFDILLNFSRLENEDLENLRSNLDDPSNGITLEMNAHAGFDRFDWCMQKTKFDNTYTIKVYKQMIHPIPDNVLIRFEDHSQEFPTARSNQRKKTVPISLPNPRFLEIHSALAGILHMSGTGIFFDKLLKQFVDGNVSAVRCFPDLEDLMDNVMPPNPPSSPVDAN